MDMGCAVFPECCLDGLHVILIIGSHGRKVQLSIGICHYWDWVLIRLGMTKQGCFRC